MPATPSTSAVEIAATPAQQAVLDRIALQRRRLREERAEEAAQAAAVAQDRPVGALGHVARAIRIVRGSPLLLGAVALGGMALGPARIARWVGLLLPVLLRSRRR